MNRDEAINGAGIEKVEKVEHENLDFTGRTTEGTQYDGYTEFSATVDIEGYDTALTIYVFIDSDVLLDVENLDGIDWSEAMKEAYYEIS